MEVEWKIDLNIYPIVLFGIIQLDLMFRCPMCLTSRPPPPTQLAHHPEVLTESWLLVGFPLLLLALLN
jgi:hypothetical protein